MCTIRMLKFLPVIIWSALSLAIYQGTFFPLMTLGMDPEWSDSKKIKNCTLALITMGVSEAAGGLFNGHL